MTSYKWLKVVWNDWTFLKIHWNSLKLLEMTVNGCQLGVLQFWSGTTRSPDFMTNFDCNLSLIWQEKSWIWLDLSVTELHLDDDFIHKGLEEESLSPSLPPAPLAAAAARVLVSRILPRPWETVSAWIRADLILSLYINSLTACCCWIALL